MDIHAPKIIKSLLLGSALVLTPTMALSMLIPGEAGKETTATVQQTRNSFFDLYAENRVKSRPNYITADFWLLSYSLIRNSTLAELEQKQIQPLFETLLTDLSRTITTEAKDPAQIANQDYLNIITALLTGENPVNSARATKELALIIAAKGVEKSPLWEMNIDYSQFKPRGRYTDIPEQRQYFQAMRYAGSILFAVKASPATGISEAMAQRMTQQAVLLSQAMQTNQTATKLDQLLNWQMGPADDLTTEDINKVLKGLKDSDIKQTQQALFTYAKQQHKQPKIIGAVVDSSQLAPNTTAADVLTGWRLMPLRYSTDNAVFQQLISPNTGEYIADCKKCPLPFGASLSNGKIVKGYPSAKELMALFKSKAAQNWVIEQRENKFANYETANAQAAKIIEQAQGLNAQQISLLQQWLQTKALNEQQAEEHLNSSLGFWTWQRYINLLYTKQSYSLTSKSISILMPRPGASLEKATALYQNLLKLVKQHQKQTPGPVWDEFSESLTTAIAISKKQDAKLTIAEEGFLNELDTRILSYTGGVKDKPIVVDVHTHSGEGMVVEEAVGLATVVEEGKAWGARFTHHEFKQPMAERLDNAGWLKKLGK